MTSLIMDLIAFMSPSSSILCVLLFDRVIAASLEEHASNIRIAKLDGTCSSDKPCIKRIGQLILMEPVECLRTIIT